MAIGIDAATVNVTTETDVKGWTKQAEDGVSASNFTSDTLNFQVSSGDPEKKITL
jgi:hypothetical protein